MVGLNVLGTVTAAIFLLFLLLFCCRFYFSLARRVVKGDGLVNPGALGLPDLLVMAVLIGWFGLLIVQTVQAAPAAAGEKELSLEHLIGAMMLQGILVGGILAFLGSRKISLVELFGLRRVTAMQAIGWASLMLLAAYPLVKLTMALSFFALGKEAPTQEIISYFSKAIDREDWGPILATFGTGVIIAPLCEEIVFRGYFYPIAKRYTGPVTAALCTSLLFAAIHFNALSFPALVVLAICFVLAYEATGSLAVPILMHAGFNAVSLVETIFIAPHLP